MTRVKRRPKHQGKNSPCPTRRMIDTRNMMRRIQSTGRRWSDLKPPKPSPTPEAVCRSDFSQRSRLPAHSGAPARTLSSPADLCPLACLTHRPRPPHWRRRLVRASALAHSAVSLTRNSRQRTGQTPARPRRARGARGLVNDSTPRWPRGLVNETDSRIAIASCAPRGSPTRRSCHR